MGSPTRAVESAFQLSLIEFAELNDIQVASTNVKYVRATGVPYVKADFLPGEPSQADIGPLGSNRHVGVFQPTLFYPFGIGTMTPGTQADNLVDHFKRGTILSQDGLEISITCSYAEPAMIEPGWLYIPITVRYRCYSEN